MSIVEQIGAAIERVGWSEISRRSGAERTMLHRSFGKRPRRGVSFRTIERVLPAVGLELVLKDRGE